MVQSHGSGWFFKQTQPFIQVSNAHSIRNQTDLRGGISRYECQLFVYKYFQLFIYIFPDELALVDAAFAYNCKLIKRSPQSAVVSLPGEGLIEFEVLHVLPFDSDRKRMSIILRHPLTRERILFCKGADSAIFSRLEAPEVGSEEEALLEKTQQHLNMYAKEGLRVLVMAKRILSEHEYEEWLILHEKAEVCKEVSKTFGIDAHCTVFENYSKCRI